MRTHRVFQILVLVVLVSALYVTLTYTLYTELTERIPGANDFFSRWMGARALFLRGENPYSDAVTREIQIGMYGRLARLDEDQVAFVYPLYAAFVAAPLVTLPYEQAQASWMAFLLVTTFGGVNVWARFNHQILMPSVFAVLVFGALIFYPIVRGIFLGQYTLFTSICLTLAVAAIQAKRDGLAGMMLALATVKPQPMVFLAPAMIVWAIGQKRWTVVVSASISICALISAGMLWVLMWIVDFVQALRKYADYQPVGPPIQTFSEWLDWLSEWLRRNQLVMVFSGLLMIVALPWVILFATVRGDAEATLVTLVLPFLSLAMWFRRSLGARGALQT